LLQNLIKRGRGVLGRLMCAPGARLQSSPQDRRCC
jgi:hypothetical protein